MRVSKHGSLNTFADKILYLAHLRFSSNSSIFVALRVSHFFIHIAATRQPIRKNTKIMWLYPLEFNRTLTLTVSLELNVIVVLESDGLFPSLRCTLRSKPHLSITLSSPPNRSFHTYTISSRGSLLSIRGLETTFSWIWPSWSGTENTFECQSRWRIVCSSK